MIDKTKKLNKRQGIILENMVQEKQYFLRDITTFFTETESPSLATLRRDISQLVFKGFLIKKGNLKSTTYALTTFGMMHSPIDAHVYCSVEVDKRKSNIGYNFSLFRDIQDELFSEKEINNLNKYTENFKNKSKDISHTLAEKELERFTIELSWKSSTIEGNTYTLLDTELLLKEGIESSGHTKKEAIMILNHKKAFQYILSHKEKWTKPDIRLVEDVHRLLVDGLDVSFGLRSKKVGVTGSKYIPLSVSTQIQEALSDVCSAIDAIKNPYAKALLALVGISYIQPFEDGNKRTARLFANAILVAYDCAPLSYRNVDEITYRESILVFYEKNSIVPMKKIFSEQYIFSCENYLKF